MTVTEVTTRTVDGEIARDGTTEVCECGHIMVVHTAYLHEKDNHCHVPDGCGCTNYVPATATATIERTERTLYTLAELKDAHPDGHRKATEWISEGESEMWEGGPAVDSALEILADAGLTIRGKQGPSYDISHRQGSMWFAMPGSTDVDVPRFLRAMKRWADRGWTPLDYTPGQRVTMRRATTIRIDLRARDYQITREVGLAVHERNNYGGYCATEEFEDDIGAYGCLSTVSDATKALYNEFLTSLCDRAMQLIRDDYEWRTSDEDYLREQAEANEWLFTEEGAIA